jgi:hypothetical protein
MKTGVDELELGVERVVHRLPSSGRGPLERALDRFETTVAESHGE